MTSVKLADPGDWTEHWKRMGPGRRAKILDGTGGKGENSRVWTPEGTGSVDHRSIRQRSTPGSVMD